MFNYSDLFSNLGCVIFVLFIILSVIYLLIRFLIIHFTKVIYKEVKKLNERDEHKKKERQKDFSQFCEKSESD